MLECPIVSCGGSFFIFQTLCFLLQRANNVQVIQMCEALTRFGYQVTLVCYRTRVSEEEILMPTEWLTHFGFPLSRCSQSVISSSVAYCSL